MFHWVSLFCHLSKWKNIGAVWLAHFVMWSDLTANGLRSLLSVCRTVWSVARGSDTGLQRAAYARSRKRLHSRPVTPQREKELPWPEPNKNRKQRFPSHYRRGSVIFTLTLSRVEPNSIIKASIAYIKKYCLSNRAPPLWCRSLRNRAPPLWFRLREWESWTVIICARL